MRRFLSILVTVAFVLAACGTSAPHSAATNDAEQPIDSDASMAEEVTDDSDQQSGEENIDASNDLDDVDDPGDDEDADPDEPDEAIADAPAVADGPSVPNFTLELDDGSTFELASAPRPVMLVFWAEW